MRVIVVFAIVIIVHSERIQTVARSHAAAPNASEFRIRRRIRTHPTLSHGRRSHITNVTRATAVAAPSQRRCLSARTRTRGSVSTTPPNTPWRISRTPCNGTAAARSKGNSSRKQRREQVRVERVARDAALADDARRAARDRRLQKEFRANDIRIRSAVRRRDARPWRDGANKTSRLTAMAFVRARFTQAWGRHRRTLR
jgi:hypothetical protein